MKESSNYSSELALSTLKWLLLPLLLANLYGVVTVYEAPSQMMYMHLLLQSSQRPTREVLFLSPFYK